MQQFAALVAHTAYPTATILTVTLMVWSLVYLYTKTKDQGHWSDVHTTLSTLLGVCFSLLLLNVMYKHGK